MHTFKRTVSRTEATMLSTSIGTHPMNLNFTNKISLRSGYGAVERRRRNPTSQSTTRIAMAIQIRFMMAIEVWNRNQRTARMIAITSKV